MKKILSLVKRYLVRLFVFSFPEINRKRYNHIFIFNPVHGDSTESETVMDIEYLSDIPKDATSYIRFRKDGEIIESYINRGWFGTLRDIVLIRRMPQNQCLSERIAIPSEFFGTGELQIVALKGKSIWVSQWLGLTIEKRTKSKSPETSSRIWCPAPWVQMNVGKSNASPCCNLKRKFRIPFRDDSDDYDPWNSKTMQALRSALVKGDAKYCFESCSALKYTQNQAQEKIARIANSNISDVAVNQAFLRGDTCVAESPSRIKLTVNHFCNHACIFCSRDIRSSWKANKAIFALIQRHGSGLSRLGMTGGEPLIFLDELAGNISSLETTLRGVAIEITTNASLIERSIDFLTAIDDLTMYVSLNAGTRETYKLVHRVDHFEKIIKGIELLKERRVNKPLYIRLKMVITQQNYADISDYVKLAQQLKVDKVQFTFALLYERADMTSTEQIHLDTPEYKETVQSLENAKTELKESGITLAWKVPGWKRQDESEALALDE